MDDSSSQNHKIHKKSFFSRKPVKRSSRDTPPHTPLFTPPLEPSSIDDSPPAEPLRSPSPISREPSLDTLSSNPNRSIIPEPLKELPSWYHTEGEWATTSTHQFRARYPIHNPVGPQFYRNVHLSPPIRPASVFSPSFPAMYTEPASAPSPPHTPPSGSPLPTPNSSQTRIPDPSGKVRTRKLSNTAHDTVDLLDGSDPYGTNWHHESPYDVGLTGDRNVASSDAPDARLPPHSRSRISSFGAPPPHKTTTPSPLSQSTSAIHLHPPDQDVPPVARRLTKRRKPFEGLFGLSPAGPRPDTASVTPSTPAPSTQTVTNRFFKRQSIFKSPSTSSIPQTISSIVPSEKRQKRGSMLGRFARRFSIVRRVAGGHSRGGSLDASNEWSRGDRQSLQVTDRASTVTRPASMSNPMSPSEKRQSARVQPPRAETTPSPDSPPLETPKEEGTQDGLQTLDEKRDSISSLEVSYSIGRLTIANPDVPGSADASPVNRTYPLPASRTGPMPAQLPPRVTEKPLPLPVPLSAIIFPETRVVDSPSALTPPSNGLGSATPTRVPAPIIRAPSSEGGQKPRPAPSSSLPIPISRAVSKGGQRASRSSPSSSAPASASTSLSPPIHPTIHPISTSAPPVIETDSPLSRASIIANPPTPYVEPTRIDNSPPTGQPDVPPAIHLSIPSPVVTPLVSSTPPTASPHEPHKLSSPESPLTKNQGSRQLKPSSSVRSRETETFHLIRSPSAGATQPTGESIIVGGQQWAVVGGSTQRSRTKKEKDDSRRSHIEPERHESKRQDRTIEKVMLLSSPISRCPLTYDVVAKVAVPTPSKTEARKSRTKDSSSSRKRSSQAESKDQVHRSTTVPSSRPSGTSAPPPPPSRERRPSQGRRPTSELTSAAEMNALRAREVWEMDRLWKGRSMAYEGPQVVYAQSIGDVASTTSVNGVGNGSAHTSYKLQQSFPFPTPTGVYSPSSAAPPPSSMQPMQQGSPLYEFPSGVRSYPDLATIPSIGSPDSTPSTSSRNPLPPPPRLSPYRPGPIPASFAEMDDRATAEYWSKYAGVGVVSSTH
ncbi:hypothetical protein BJV78DRAFT_1277636 [Lactifluus subvellereus]|nr:hypothetical protein BJV78DRAFT_1277636 [Lactifluus subvellereus]